MNFLTLNLHSLDGVQGDGLIKPPKISSQKEADHSGIVTQNIKNSAFFCFVLLALRQLYWIHSMSQKDFPETTWLFHSPAYIFLKGGAILAA